MEKMIKECDAFWVKIYMSGDVRLAKQVCLEFCLRGLCVNLYETDYIYTMGSEFGFVVELINYARFPKTSNEITNAAQELADLLLERLFQGSYTLMTPEKSYFVTRRKQDIG
jgi:hypothetical protein